MRSCSSAAIASRWAADSSGALPSSDDLSVTRYSTARSRRRTGMPQLCAMSLALEAQGETVPSRGVTTNSGAGGIAFERFAVGQQRAQAFAVRRRGRLLPGGQVHEARREPADPVMHRLQPRQELLDTEGAEGAPALELGDVQGHCETCDGKRGAPPLTGTAPSGPRFYRPGSRRLRRATPLE